MFVNAIAAHTDLIVTLLAGASAFGAIVVVCWSIFAPNVLHHRVRQIVGARGEIRARASASSQGGGAPALLTTRPKQIFKNIFDRMKLADQAEDGDVVRKVRMAGYRGQG